MNHMSCRYLLEKNRGGGEGKRQREGGGSKSLLSKKCKDKVCFEMNYTLIKGSTTTPITVLCGPSNIFFVFGLK